MNREERSENIIIKPYKDAFRNYIIDPEDMLKWLEDEGIKDNLDACLNEL